MPAQRAAARSARSSAASSAARLRQAPGTPLAVGREAAAAGLEHLDAALAQQRDVGLVAGCSHMRSFIAGATSTGQRAASAVARQQVVGEPVGELGDRVGRGRRDQEDVGGGGQREVAGRVVVGQRLAGEGAAQRVALERRR